MLTTFKLQYGCIGNIIQMLLLRGLPMTSIIRSMHSLIWVIYTSLPLLPLILEIFWHSLQTHQPSNICFVCMTLRVDGHVRFSHIVSLFQLYLFVPIETCLGSVNEPLLLNHVNHNMQIQDIPTGDKLK